MLIFAIDDEPNMLYLLHEAIAEAEPDADILDFSLGSEAVAYLETYEVRPDVIFSDIRMPGLSGLEMAARIRQLTPDTKLVFVTGYDHAMDAYQLHVSGYIQKPAEAERVREELNYLFPEEPAAKEKLRVQCFGPFEVYWKGRPLAFSRKQTKELLALLVDRRGALCSTKEIIATIWEEPGDISSAKHRVWNLTSDLRASLKAIGMEDVLISRNRQIAVWTDLLECDYYLALSGDPSAQRAFHGEYMEQYSWAEGTKAHLLFRFQSQTQESRDLSS